MSIPLRIKSRVPARGRREPGMMWRYRPGDTRGRECWWIMLPDHPDIGTPGHPYEISWRTTHKDRDGLMWAVTGEPPLITVTPSIDVWRFARNPAFVSLTATPGVPSHVRDGSYWHGWITNGMLVGLNDPS